MSAPFTQEFIQTQIEFYANKMQVITTSQEYRYTQQSGADVDLRRADLEDVQKTLDKWIEYMNTYYPTAYSDGGNQIEFWTVGISEG